MAENEVTNAQILSRLRRRKSPATAVELGLPSRGGAQRLRGIEGVVEVGRKRTGKAGRPAALFTDAEKVPAPTIDAAVGEDAKAIRSGALSAHDAATRAEAEERGNAS